MADDQALLASYGGIENSLRSGRPGTPGRARGALKSSRNHAPVFRSRKGTGNRKSKNIERFYGARLARGVDSNIGKLYKAGALPKHWDLTPGFGNKTAQAALCQGAAWVHECKEEDCAQAEAVYGESAMPAEETQNVIQGDFEKGPAFGHDEDSLALDVLLASLLQARSVLKEKKRDRLVRYRDCVKLYDTALRKAVRILLKESDSLRRAAGAIDDEGVSALFEQDAVMKNNLACDLGKLLGEAGRVKHDMYKHRILLKRGITDVCEDYIL